MQRIWKEIDFALHFFGLLEMDSPGQAFLDPSTLDYGSSSEYRSAMVNRIGYHRAVSECFFQLFNLIGIGVSWLFYRDKGASLYTQVSFLAFLASFGFFTCSHRMLLYCCVKTLSFSDGGSNPRPSEVEKVARKQRSAHRVMALSRIFQAVGFYTVLTRMASSLFRL